MNIRHDPACIGGLHEVCVGVPDLAVAAADFAAYGCRPAESGELDARASLALYGVESAVPNAYAIGIGRAHV